MVVVLPLPAGPVRSINPELRPRNSSMAVLVSGGSPDARVSWPEFP